MLKRAIAIFAFILCSISAFAAVPTPVTGQYVKSTSGDATSAYSDFAIANLPGATTVGNYLIVEEVHCPQFSCSGTSTGAYTGTVTDTQGNTFYSCGTNAGFSTNISISQWYAKITTAGTDQVTLHTIFGSNAYGFTGEVTEVSGIAANVVCRGANSATLPGVTTTPSLSTAYPVSNKQFVWSSIYSDTNDPVAPLTRLHSGSFGSYFTTSAEGTATASSTSLSFNPYIVIGSLAADDVLNVGVTYYVDFTLGSDSQTGLDKTHTSGSTGPFKHAPYQGSCASLCAAVVLGPKDHVIFKGGETWTYATSGDISLTSVNGLSGQPFVYSVDQTWYTGGSYTKPKLDLAYSHSVGINMNGVHYATIDGLEIEHVFATTTTDGGLIVFNTSANLTFSNLYLHGWRLTGSGTRLDDAHGGIICFNYTDIVNDMPTVVMTDSVIENSENTGDHTQNGLAARYVGVMTRVTIHDVSSAVLFTIDWNGGEQYNVSYPSGNYTCSIDEADPNDLYHTNGVYLDPSTVSQSTGYIRNSKFHDELTNMAYPNIRAGSTVYVYNNLFYGVIGSQGPIAVEPFQYAMEGPGNVFIANNLCYLPDDDPGSGYNCIEIRDRSSVGQYVGNLTAVNNQVIGPSGSVLVDNPSLIHGAYSHPTNRIQLTADAVTQGYVQATLWAPQNSSGDTVRQGTAQTATFTTDVLGITRTVPWDIGPYQFVATVITYHVATTGNNANNGLSLGTAFLTIGHCVVTMASGDTCEVHAGTYTEAVQLGFGDTTSGGSWNLPNTLKVHSGDTVTWKENTTDHVIQFDGDSSNSYPQYWVIDGFIFDGQTKTSPSLITGGGDHVRIKNNEIKEALGSCIIGAGGYWEFTNNTVHDCGTGHNAVPDHCFYWHGSNVLLDSNTVYHCSGYGIQIFDSGHNDVNNGTISNNIFRDNYYGTHTVGGGGGGILVGTGSGHRVFNNLVYDTVAGGGNSNVGITPDFRCGWTLLPPFGPGGQPPCEVYNNSIYGIHGSAIDLGQDDNNGAPCDEFNLGGNGVNAPCTITIVRDNLIYGNMIDEVKNSQAISTTDHNVFTNPTWTNAEAGTFTIAVGSTARGAGLNLTYLGITALNADYATVARPPVSAWDAGAYQYVNPVCVPDHLSFSAQPTGTTLGLTLGTVSVQILDSGSSLCTPATNTIVLAADGAATWAALSSASSLSKAAVAGVATWTDLSISPTVGSGSITAASSGLTGATSNSITISAPVVAGTGNGIRARIRVR